MSCIYIHVYFIVFLLNSLKKLLNEKKTPKQKSLLSSLYVVNHTDNNYVVGVIVGLIECLEGILQHLQFHLLLDWYLVLLLVIKNRKFMFDVNVDCSHECMTLCCCVCVCACVCMYVKSTFGTYCT